MSYTKVEGLNEVLTFLSNMDSEASFALDGSLGVLAAMIERRAKQLVHVKTGTLQRSIFSQRIKAGVYVVGSKVFYAGYVEYGTSRARAYPYLRPAWEENAPKAEKIILDFLFARFQKYNRLGFD